MTVSMPANPIATAPLAARRPTSRTVHGNRIEDDYGWLRAENWQEVMRDPSVLAPEIRAHLDAENAATAACLAPTEALQATLFEEMKARIKQDDSSVPVPDGPFAYATRYREGLQHPQIVRLGRDGEGEIVLLDANVHASATAYFKLGGVSHSPDHALLAWSYDDNGSEYHTIRVRLAETSQDLDDVVAETTGAIVWTADSAGFFYVRVDDNHCPNRVFHHTLGADPATDPLIHEEADAGFFVGIGKTQSGRFVTIDIHDHETSEVHLIDAASPLEPARLVAARATGHEYDVDDWGDVLAIRTNLAGAEDFKIVVAPVQAPGPENWLDLVPHVPGTLILSSTALAGHLVRLERFEGLPRIVIRARDGGAEHTIAFDEEAYSLGLSAGYEYDTRTIRFTYSSMTTPSRVYDYDVESRERVLRKEQEVPSGHDPAAYVTRRVMAPAHDGETVPVTLLYRRATALDGSAPCLLYGYGAYGISIPASFSTTALSLVDRGFIYAIAHVRGGKDKGYRWYAHGRREHKANTFRDFISAAEHLVAGGFTAPDRIVAQGGSAGGMLMGAIANMRPDLFAGIIAEVPFVDVLATMLDPTLPLTPPEWPEWGNPIDDPVAFAAIRAYSPYDNVAARAYPAILAVAGLTDPRVTYWEPAKWIARLRATRTNDAPLLLKTNMDAGHGGAAGRFDRLKEVALVQAFALLLTGKLG